MTKKKLELSKQIKVIELELPKYIKVIDNTTLKVKAGAEWEGYKWHTITLADLKRYIQVEAQNITSGCRRIGTIVGDWRPIDNLAHELDFIFAKLNGKA